MTTMLNTIAPIGIGSAILIIGTLAAAAQNMPALPKAIKEAGVIRFGVKCDSPPFGSSGPDGKPIGIEVDMAKQIASYAFGSPDKAELTCVTSDARVPSLTGGKIDLILATLGKTQARAEVIDFSDTYFWGTSNIIVAKDSKAQRLADLDGQAVLVVKGGSQVKWIRDNLKNSEVMQLNSTADSVQALLQGRGAGYAGDGGLIATLAANNKNLRVIEEGFDLGTNAIGLRKNEPELKAFVNAALKRLKDEKFYASDAKKYIDNAAVLETMLKGFETDPPAAK